MKVIDASKLMLKELPDGNLSLFYEVKIMKFDSNNFIVDEIYTIRFFGECPSCHEEYDSVEDEHGVITSPHFCPNCGFDIHKYNEETKTQSPWRP